MSEIAPLSPGAADDPRATPDDPALRELLNEMEGLVAILPPYRGPLPRRDDGRKMGPASA